MFRLSSKPRHTKNGKLHRRIEKRHMGTGLEDRSGCVAGFIYRDWSMMVVQLPVVLERLVKATAVLSEDRPVGRNEPVAVWVGLRPSWALVS